jgi:uncharacterized protein (DUF2141 family)
MVMLKLMSSIAVGTLLLVAPSAAAGAALGPDAASCREGAGEPAVLVNVTGFKTRSGNVRVQLYGGNPDDFLAKGKWLRRVDLPVTPSGAMKVCVSLPKAGSYAVAVRHDVNGDGKSNMSDGGGFSRNPDISLLNLKPKFKHTVIAVNNGVTPVNVVLNYKQGLSVGPIKRS